MTTYFFRNIEVCNISATTLHPNSSEYPPVCQIHDITIQPGDTNTRLDPVDGIIISGSSLPEQPSNQHTFTRADALTAITGLGLDNPDLNRVNLQAALDYSYVKTHAEQAMIFLSRNSRSQEILLSLDRRAIVFNRLYPSQRQHLDIRPIYFARPENNLALADSLAVNSALDLVAEILSHPTSAEDPYIPSTEEISLVYFLLEETKIWANANSNDSQREALLNRRTQLMSRLLDQLFRDPFRDIDTYVQAALRDPFLSTAGLNQMILLLTQMDSPASDYRSLPNYVSYNSLCSRSIAILKQALVAQPLQRAREISGARINLGQELRVIPQVLTQLRTALDQAQTNSSQGVAIRADQKQFIRLMLNYCRASLNALIRRTATPARTLDAGAPEILDASMSTDVDAVVVDAIDYPIQTPQQLLGEITALTQRLAAFETTRSQPAR